MEDLQGLLEKINREGVEKADAEAKRIIEAAKAEAAKIVADAKAEAAAAKAAAEKDSAAYAARAEETVRQAARDVVIGVKDAVTGLLEKLLAKDVDAALAAKAPELAAAAIRDLTGPGEISCAADLAAALKAQLAGQGDFTVVADPSVGTGFTVRLDGGRVEHAFTGEVISSELAKRLRADLAKLV